MGSLTKPKNYEYILLLVVIKCYSILQNMFDYVEHSYDKKL